jgi:hypothetical protein
MVALQIQWIEILLRQSKLSDAATVTYLNSKYATLQSLNNLLVQMF